MFKNKINFLLTVVFFGAMFFQAAQTFAQTCAPTPSGLVSWYRAEGNAVDSADGNNGVLEGNTTYAAGKVGQAFSLDGNGDRVVINNPTNLQLQNLTIEGWIKRSSSSIVTNDPRTGFNSGVFFSFDVGGYGFIIDEPTGRIALTHNGSSAVFSTATVTDTNYHHIAVTKSGNQVVFYVDGAADAPVTFNDTFTFAANAAAIGTRGGSDLKNAFFGQIDELSIYNRALTPAEIQSIVAAGSAGKCKPTAPTPVCVAPPPNIAAWLPGDANANDISGNGNNGTLLANATYASGKVAQGFLFNNNNGDSVRVPDSPSLNFTTALTVEAWINPSMPNTAASFTPIVDKGYSSSGNSPTYILTYITGSGQVAFGVSAGGSTGTFASAPNPIPFNTFTHVAGTYDGTTVRIYINGVLADSQATTISSLAPSGTPLSIGKSVGFFNTFFGIIDEVTLYNRTLSQAEIQAIVNADSAGKCKNAPTAAAVSVSGRVATAAGRGISRAIVSVTDGNGNIRATTTNSFGYYSFTELPAGNTYIFSVRSKRYQFAQPSQVLSVNEDQTDVNFTAFLESKLR